MRMARTLVMLMILRMAVGIRVGATVRVAVSMTVRVTAGRMRRGGEMERDAPVRSVIRGVRMERRRDRGKRERDHEQETERAAMAAHYRQFNGPRAMKSTTSHEIRVSLSNL